MASFCVVPAGMTREEWLERMTSLLQPLFQGIGHPIPDVVRVSCGWPSHKALRSGKKTSRTIGQCWSSHCAGDETRQIFISPCLTDAIEVSATLAHELIHAVLDCKHGHKGPFRKIAVALGLEGPMTATHAGAELKQRLNELVDSVGPYPHGGLDATLMEKKQSTRMLKVVCPDCGYTVRTTAKWLEVGVPTCACGTEMEVAS